MQEYHRFTDQLTRLKRLVNKMEESWKNWEFTDEYESTNPEMDLQKPTAQSLLHKGEP